MSVYITIDHGQGNYKSWPGWLIFVDVAAQCLRHIYLKGQLNREWIHPKIMSETFSSSPKV